MRDFVVKWNSTWKFDYWYRKKYNIPFNSEAHRAISQIDIKTEYVEEAIMNSERRKFEKEREDKKHYAQTGEWLRVDEKQQEALFKLI